MNFAEYGQMYQLESTHWYFVGKARLIRRLIQRLTASDKKYRLLDVGCGTGNILSILSHFGEAVGVDTSSVALDFCRRRGLQQLHLTAPGSPLPFPNESFDIVCAFDILEHLDDDRGLLLQIKRVCRAGGMILLTVPAHPMLWSGHDEALHHKRRYSKQLFRSLIQSAELHTSYLSYANSLLFPAAIAYRILKKGLPRNEEPVRSEFFVKLPAPVNALLLSVFTVESWLIPRISLPFGLSLLAVVRPAP